MIYVCGYGRSGSTLLGRFLAVQSRALAVGEISRLSSSQFVARGQCSSGSPYPECVYWAEVHRRLAELNDGQPQLPMEGVVSWRPSQACSCLSACFVSGWHRVLSASTTRGALR